MKYSILSVSRIKDDPRVRRQGDALVDAGHEVFAVGLSGGQCEQPDWPIATVEEPSTVLRRFGTIARGLVGRLGSRAALTAYWTSSLHRSMYKRALAQPSDVVIANDWRVLPIALRLASRWDASVHYDSHEYAIEERADSRAWRVLIAPFVRQIEGACIGKVQTVSTVADGIADAMQSIYALADRPVVVRNTPTYQPMPLHPSRTPLRVLFQGGLLPDRGLEELIRSVPAWSDDKVLTIRGPAEPGYRNALVALIGDVGMNDRIALEGSAPMTDLVRLANEHDIGVFTPSVVSEQMRFALPNKLFEYLMGGLGVVATDLEEVGRVLRTSGAGFIVPEPSAASIASVLNGLTTEEIMRAKQRALVAAHELSWDREQERLLSVLARAVG